MNLKDLHPWVRYLVVFVALAGIVYEALQPTAPRFWLLVTYTGMLGITSLVGLDRVAARIAPGAEPPPGGGPTAAPEQPAVGPGEPPPPALPAPPPAPEAPAPPAAPGPTPPGGATA